MGWILAILHAVLGVVQALTVIGLGTAIVNFQLCTFVMCAGRAGRGPVLRVCVPSGVARAPPPLYPSSRSWPFGRALRPRWLATDAEELRAQRAGGAVDHPTSSLRQQLL